MKTEPEPTRSAAPATFKRRAVGVDEIEDPTEEVPRRKVIVSEFLSLDGVMEDPGGAEGSEYGGWSFAYFNEELGQLIGEGFAASDAMLMGRTTYEQWAAFWPNQDPEENPDAAQMNGVRKYVVSTTLEE